MKKYTSVDDINDLIEFLQFTKEIKNNPLGNKQLGKDKTIGLLFFNPSLRTRLSTQKAAQNLGMDCMVMNLNSDSWTLEFEDGAVMDGSASEHVKEAAGVISQYCDIIAIRSFPTLTDKEKDEAETVISSFVKFASVPIISLEGAVEHPLQALADALTIEEYKTTQRPKVVLSWAPHPKALPQSVPNSFVKIMKKMEVDFVITHPEGYELNPKVTEGVKIEYDQEEAFKNADFIYAKNWSSYTDYGKVVNKDPNWTIGKRQMDLTDNARFMHCLPVRRNMIVTDEILDSDASIVIPEAHNRVYSAQAVITKILEGLK
ncbi:MAG: N-acetylornithine carbamoyltransferase [Flavobacteriaceae bacterium]|jgi:N-succinyl-L-ornithine transcarbamylase|nr:N-acetylornithine carbamoyltransferase [Flavobacteriaceae bacterium]